nr:protein 9797 [Theama mediterranea]
MKKAVFVCVCVFLMLFLHFVEMATMYGQGGFESDGRQYVEIKGKKIHLTSSHNYKTTCLSCDIHMAPPHQTFLPPTYTCEDTCFT